MRQKKNKKKLLTAPSEQESHSSRLQDESDKPIDLEMDFAVALDQD